MEKIDFLLNSSKKLFDYDTANTDSFNDIDAIKLSFIINDTIFETKNNESYRIEYYREHSAIVFRIIEMYGLWLEEESCTKEFTYPLTDKRYETFINAHINGLYDIANFVSNCK